MKIKKSQILILSLLLFFISLTSGLFAQDEASSLHDSGNFFIGIHGSYGGTYSNVNISTSNSVTFESALDQGYAFGADFTLTVANNIGLILGADYSMKTLGMEINNYGETTGSCNINSTFLNFNAGIKGFIGIFYCEAGIFAAMPIGNYSMELFDKDGNSISKKTFSDEYMEDFKNEIGPYAGLGVAIPVNDSLTIDLGVKAEVSLTDLSSDGESGFSNRSLMAKAGITVKL
ncbi:MAG: hypothetical protein GY754_20355 [bacterium]|nr:hypothetical protein [bacterium]